jgi:multidrug efflux pump subunit AcrB
VRTAAPLRWSDRNAPASAAASAPTPATSQPQELSLASPIQIDALRIQRVKTHFRDKSVTPPVDTQFELTVRVSDVGEAVDSVEDVRNSGYANGQPSVLVIVMCVLLNEAWMCT